MSEHFAVNGIADYWHLPYDEEGAFTFCKSCGKTCKRVTVEFHQGWTDDWMSLRCPKCKKAIWTSRLKRKMTKDDKNCWICGKPTNWIDCYSQDFWVGEGIDHYICSKKCADKESIIDSKSHFFLDELDLCLKEQGLDISFDVDGDLAEAIMKMKFKLARKMAASSVGLAASSVGGKK